MSEITRRRLLLTAPAAGLVSAVPVAAAVVETPDEALERCVREIAALFEARIGGPCVGQVHRLSGRYDCQSARDRDP